MEIPEFDEKVVPSPFCREDCFVCTERVNTFLMCCRKPICRKCFDRWTIKEGKVTCPHCRDVFYDLPRCVICRVRHEHAISTKEKLHTYITQALILRMYRPSTDE